MMIKRITCILSLALLASCGQRANEDGKTEITLMRFFGSCEAKFGQVNKASEGVGECGIITTLVNEFNATNTDGIVVRTPDRRMGPVLRPAHRAPGGQGHSHRGGDARVGPGRLCAPQAGAAAGRRLPARGHRRQRLHRPCPPRHHLRRPQLCLALRHLGLALAHQHHADEAGRPDGRERPAAAAALARGAAGASPAIQGTHWQADVRLGRGQRDGGQQPHLPDAGGAAERPSCSRPMARPSTCSSRRSPRRSR